MLGCHSGKKPRKGITQESVDTITELTTDLRRANQQSTDSSSMTDISLSDPPANGAGTSHNNNNNNNNNNTESAIAAGSSGNVHRVLRPSFEGIGSSPCTTFSIPSARSPTDRKSVV
eukprot:TRINITY_DN1138_c0_g2_i1.p4 TRINITY_DN1138_c0_g2~~TRINITY_DN1138_c0_g2_i1.p4  ORF type:complete len:117 (+),score=33.82 TRINITY_DN1138_c0_g2_i1:632-982(+)